MFGLMLLKHRAEDSGLHFRTPLTLPLIRPTTQNKTVILHSACLSTLVASPRNETGGRKDSHHLHIHSSPPTKTVTGDATLRASPAHRTGQIDATLQLTI